MQHDVRTYTLPIQGVYPSMFEILALKLAEGRLLNEDDEAARARVAVISSDAKLKLFSGEYAHRPAHPHRRHQLQGGRRARAAHAGRRRQRQQDHLHPVQHHERLQGHALSRRHLAVVRRQRLRTGREAGARRAGAAIQLQARRQARCLRLQHDEAVEAVPDHHHRTEDPARLHRHADAGHRRRGADEHHAGRR